MDTTLRRDLWDFTVSRQPSLDIRSARIVVLAWLLVTTARLVVPTGRSPSTRKPRRSS